MTFARITKKIMFYNRKNYLLYCFSIVFAACMTGAYGILLYSPVVTKVLIATGSTYMIAKGMFLITVLGMAVFLLYANNIYMKYKMGDIGIFVSLGLRPKALQRMMSHELNLLFFISTITGLLLSFPAAYLLWNLLTLFLTRETNGFAIGWQGVLSALLLCFFMWVLLKKKNSHDISKADIMAILRAESAPEIRKESSAAAAAAGLVMIPLGIILFNWAAVQNSFLKNISLLFLLPVFAGLFMFITQFTAIGTFFKKINKKCYLSNLLFFNFIKQKGRQYTSAIFVSAILITVTIFCICFNGASFVELYVEVQKEPYDFAVLTGYMEENIDERLILAKAEENGVDITKSKILDVLLIGRMHQYENPGRNEWASEFVISESNYNSLSKDEIHVGDGEYLLFTPADSGVRYTAAGKEGLFYNPSRKEEFHLKKAGIIYQAGIVNKTAELDSFIITDDKEFARLKSSLTKEYRLNYYLMKGNGRSLDSVKNFQSSLLDSIVTAWNGRIFSNFMGLPITDMVPQKQEYMTYEGNEQYAARWWEFYPFAKETNIQLQLESGAVYILLISFIAIVSFVSAVMVTLLRIISTIMQDRALYKEAALLGMTRKRLEKLILQQLSFVYYLPSICGGGIGVLMMHSFMKVSSITSVAVITNISIALWIIILVIQTIFLAAGKKYIFRMAFRDFIT